MKILEFTLPDNANIFLIGDRHKGSSFSSDSDWEKAINKILSEYEGVEENFVVDHGDIIEGIAIDDPRYDPLEHKDSVLKQIGDAIKDYFPIRKNIITILDGNHPKKLSKRFGDITKHICYELNVPYGTWSSHITYKDMEGNTMFKHFATHGRKMITTTVTDTARRKDNLKDSLRKSLSHKFGDCLLMSRGHSHKIVKSEPAKKLYLYADENGIHQGYKSFGDTPFIDPSQRYYASTGSFFKLYGEDGSVSYAEEFDYDPIEIGFIIAKIRDRQLIELDEITL